MNKALPEHIYESDFLKLLSSSCICTYLGKWLYLCEYVLCICVEWIDSNKCNIRYLLPLLVKCQRRRTGSRTENTADYAFPRNSYKLPTHFSLKTVKYLTVTLSYKKIHSVPTFYSTLIFPDPYPSVILQQTECFYEMNLISGSSFSVLW